MANNIVTGEMYEEIDGQLHEIKRQIRQKNGYPYNPEELRKALQAIVEGKFEQKPNSPLPVWKTIKIGTGLKTADDFRKALNDSGYKIGQRVDSVLDNTALTITPNEMELDLVLVLLKELGVENHCAGYKEIIARAKEMGLGLCPTETALQLWLQSPDLYIPGRRADVMSEPIANYNGKPCIFRIGYSAQSQSGRWIDAISSACKGNFFPPSWQFIFVKPRK